MMNSNPYDISKQVRQTSDWAIFTSNNGNTYSVEDPLPINVTLQNTPVKAYINPVVTMNGSWYANDLNNRSLLYAVDLATNTIKWQYTTEGATTINYTIAKNNLIFIASATGIIALGDTGKAAAVKWSKTERAVRINYDDTKLYYVTIGSDKRPYLVVLDQVTGNELGRFAVVDYNDTIGSLTIGGGTVFITVSNDIYGYFKIYAIDPASGNNLWIYNMGEYKNPSSLTSVYYDGRIYLDYIPSNPSNPLQFMIIAIDAINGKKLWAYNAGGEFTHSGILNRFTVLGNSLVTMNKIGYLAAVDKNTGQERWKVKYIELNPPGDQPADVSSSGMLIGAGDKIVLNNAKRIKMFETSTGRLLRSFMPSHDTNYYPVAVAENSLFLSNGKELATYMVPKPGSDTTKPTIIFQSYDPPRFNPQESTGQTNLQIWLSEEAFLVLNVIDSNGTIIRHIDFGIVQPGWGSLSWNGRDDQGKPVPYGKYHYSINLQDMAGNTNYYDYPDKVITVGDSFAVTLTETPFRSSPGAEYGILETIPAGQTLIILDELADWFKVLHQNSTVGYVQKKDVSYFSRPALVYVITSTVNYVVAPGDTLYKIASKLGSTVDIIVSANNLANPNALYAGQKLQVPKVVQQPVTYIHTVVSGDTLWKISASYQVPMYLIIKNNKLVPPYMLSIGQKLLIS